MPKVIAAATRNKTGVNYAELTKGVGNPKHRVKKPPVKPKVPS